MVLCGPRTVLRPGAPDPSLPEDPGVWTVPVGERQGNNLLAMKGLSEERAHYRSPQSAQRGQGGPADTNGPKCKSSVAMNHHFQCELKKKKL